MIIYEVLLPICHWAGYKMTYELKALTTLLLQRDGVDPLAKRSSEPTT